MRYRTKVEVITNGKTYKPGSILPEDISASDLAFLKAKKFVDPVDAAAVVTAPVEEETDGGDGGFPGFDEIQPGKLKSEDEIRKIRSKKDICAYAGSIGLDLGENSEGRSLKELQETVINFQEEQMEGKENGETEEDGDTGENGETEGE